MRGRVRVDLYGAVSEHNALCGEQMPPVREFTDAELAACRQSLKNVDVQGNPTSETVAVCLAWAVVVAVMVAMTIWILALLT